MTTAQLTDQCPDADLWQFVKQGSAAAFEMLVRRHQSVVSAVAYNACGDLALSEDVAQETFWTAWRDRAALAEPSRLRAWLCGIARNLGKNARRRAARTTFPQEAVTEVPAGAPSPAEQAVSREEESLLWQTLEEIPETYREPLVLFYREQQSVADVASALGLSEDAVKQRLSRGRGMLRERVAELVEGTLRRSRPGKNFTVAVMAGLTGLTVGAKSALAGTGTAVAGTALKSAVGASLVGGLLGPLVGLFGGWFGTWLPAELAPTELERKYVRRVGRRMLLVSVVLTLLLVAGIVAFPDGISWHPLAPLAYMGMLVGWLVIYMAYVTVEAARAAHRVRRLRAESPDAEPNDAPLRAGMVAVASRYRGRVYRSRATLFGGPLVDINVGDPLPCGSAPAPPLPERRVARGWIAIGDEAHGILLAVGSRAVGLVAIGAIARGGVSIGGIAIGVVAIGGLALGGLALGGLGAGLLAFGGLALGWQACGGMALGLDVACGGGAIAWHAAYGGAAIAHDYAVGGAAYALHANDEAAQTVVGDRALRQVMSWQVEHSGWVMFGIIFVSVVVSAVLWLAMYRREPAG
jgi:RNA polymerase sigma factor (sigma-70 family)